MIFIPAQPGPWIARVVAACARARRWASFGLPAPAPVDFVVCSDGVDWDASRSLLARLTFARDGEGPAAPRASRPPTSPRCWPVSLRRTPAW